ncbi:MAG: Lrp/AsnC family transcriptional regulator [Frankia sp.]
MDELDEAIVAVLQADARATNRDLATRVGVSPSTSLERVRSLRQRGIITGYRAEVDLAALGRPVEAMISARLRPQSRAVMYGFRDFVLSLPETISVFVVTGREDILIHVATRDTRDLQNFVLDRLTRRREIADLVTSVIFDHARKPVIEPMR